MTAISDYLRKIEKAYAAGNATEHTHRPALKELIESMASGITATNEPRRVKCGAPDFIITRGQSPAPEAGRLRRHNNDRVSGDSPLTLF